MSIYERETDNSALFLISLLIICTGWYIKQRLDLRATESLLIKITSAILFIAIVFLVFIRIKLSRSQLKPNKWDKMGGREFENQMVVWLKQTGFSLVKKTEYFDQGIDLIASLSGNIYGVQVKRSSRPVGVNAVRAAVAGLNAYGCNKAMVITNSTFTFAAKRLALVNNCQLIDGTDLRKKIIT